MSVLIKGMKMPENCGECLFFGLESAGHGMYWDYCKAIRSVLYDADNSVSEDCPLVELPPHGRLIDADALIVDLMDRGVEGLQTDDWHEIQQSVEDAPTIIEAEDEE